MEIVEVFLFIVAAIAVIAILASIIKKISSYYKQRFGYSIWSGVFVLILAFSLAGIDCTHYGANNIPLFLASGALVLLTMIQDFRLSGIGIGILGFLFQALMAVVFAFIIAGLLIGLIIKAITKRSNSALNALLGTTNEFRDGLISFPAFLRLR